MTYEELEDIQPYALEKQKKKEFLLKNLKRLTLHHYENCGEYRKLLDVLQINRNYISNISDIAAVPFLPVRLFKEYDLKSIRQEEVFKIMTSSGTTGQRVSKIYLDKHTSLLQTKILAKIMKSYFGKSRMPMIIVDSPSVIKNRKLFSARGAGITGFSVFGKDRMYALDEDMNLDVNALMEFLNRHQKEQIFLFGFTFMIWQHFYKKLAETGFCPDLTHAVLVHGGGWKKMEKEEVSRDIFHKSLEEVCGITRIYDYYGMVEQTGTVYVECECGHLHASSYSDIIIRDTQDFSVAKIGKRGIVQVLSILPESYPGHSLLTEDEGILMGEDDCPCGRKGKYFQILGRIRNAEIRGCSDTYAEIFS